MPKKPKRTTEETKAKQAEFFDTYRTPGVIAREAYRAVGVTTAEFLAWRKNAAFEEKYREIELEKCGRELPEHYAPRNPRPEPELQELWIAAYLRGGTKRAACESVGVSRSLVARWEKDPAFVRQFQDAYDDFCDSMEEHIIRAAPEDWKAAERMLQVRRPKLFGKSASGEEGTTIINVGESVIDSLLRHAKRASGGEE